MPFWKTITKGCDAGHSSDQRNHVTVPSMQGLLTEYENKQNAT